MENVSASCNSTVDSRRLLANNANEYQESKKSSLSISLISSKITN